MKKLANQSSNKKFPINLIILIFLFVWVLSACSQEPMAETVSFEALSPTTDPTSTQTSIEIEVLPTDTPLPTEILEPISTLEPTHQSHQYYRSV